MPISVAHSTRKHLRSVLPFITVLVTVAVYFLYRAPSAQKMPPKAPLNPFTFPRPPLLERTPRHLQVKWQDIVIADTKDAFWVLETTHPPTYYLPPSSILAPLAKSSHSSFCEWKGRATYWDIVLPKKASAIEDFKEGKGEKVRNRIWSYEDPTDGFKSIKDYVSFYAGPWDCYVDGELVKPQPGDFYGGWVTSEIVGQVKGGPGTWGW